ncbi:hypothetical protein D3C71_1348450 [compost metagenome]
MESIGELNQHIARNKQKTKTIRYDYSLEKPVEEVIEEVETVTSYISVIDRNGLKQLTSALKDIKDVLGEAGEDTEIEDTTETDTDIYG